VDPAALLVRHLLLPLHERYRGVQTSRHHRRLLALQLAALRSLVGHALRHSPFHRARLSGLAPEDLRSLDDLARLPPLTKDDLRDHLGEIVTGDPGQKGWTRVRTGGSSGVPVHLHWDGEARPFKEALARRHDGWAGFLPGERRAALWGNVRKPATLRARLGAAIFGRTITLDTLEVDEGSLRAFAARIRRTRTRLLFGHGHSLYLLARFALEEGLGDLGLRAVISSSEMLPPEERRVVEEAFGRIVFDRYGCEEVGIIASECEAHDGLHVAAEGVLVEVAGEAGAEGGRLLVTDLVNRATPLLRYEIGDLATSRPGPCACGRGLPRLGRVIGRTSDFLCTPEGRRVSGISFLDTVAIHIPGFRQVQVVQDRIDELVFHVVGEGARAPASLQVLAAAVARYFGPAMLHRVVPVERIPLTGRGKFQFSICRLPGSQGGAGAAAGEEVAAQLPQGPDPQP
jgi:phenylacetate-CoA ligase